MCPPRNESRYVTKSSPGLFYAACAGCPSRKAARIYQRDKDGGLEGLTDGSRQPYRHANRLPLHLNTLIVRLEPAWTGAAPAAQRQLGVSLRHLPERASIHRQPPRHPPLASLEFRLCPLGLDTMPAAIIFQR